jgi:mannose-6-phosphate isomerase-like protein (cupin superfamily)
MEVVDLRAKFELFQEHWRPKIVGELNGQEVKLAKFQGEFVWHSHAEADELFLVWRGHMRLELRERSYELGPGEMIVVPRGVEHRTSADEETWVVIFEPAATCNTGEVRDERLSAPAGERI